MVRARLLLALLMVASLLFGGLVVSGTSDTFFAAAEQAYAEDDEDDDDDDEPGPRAFVTMRNDNRIVVIDTDTDEVIKTIDLDPVLGFHPSSVAIHPTRPLLYVAGTGSTVAVIDRDTYEILKYVNIRPWPSQMVLSPDGLRLYVASTGPSVGTGGIQEIDTVNNLVLNTWVLGTARPFGIAVSPDGDRLFVSNPDEDSITVVSTADGSLLDTYKAGISTEPGHLLLSPDGKRLYVSDATIGNPVAVLDASSGALLAHLITPVTGQWGKAFSSDGKSIFVAELEFGIREFSMEDFSLLRAAATGTCQTFACNNASGISLTPDGEKVYVTNHYDGTVTVLNAADLSTRKVFDSIGRSGDHISGSWPNTVGDFIDKVADDKLDDDDEDDD